MPACHLQAEKSRIWQDNLKPKRENRMMTHQLEHADSQGCANFLQDLKQPIASFNQLLVVPMSCKQLNWAASTSIIWSLK